MASAAEQLAANINFGKMNDVIAMTIAVTRFRRTLD